MGEYSAVEALLDVGAPSLLDAAPEGPTRLYSQTRIRGWQPGAWIFVDRMVGPDGALLAVEKGQACRLSFIVDGSARTLDTRVLDWDEREAHPYLRLSWPLKIRHSSLRQHERMEVSLPCAVRSASSEMKGHVIDISQGGSGLRVPRPLTKGERVEVSLDLSGQRLCMTLEVRSVRSLGAEFIIGCSMAPDQVLEQRAIVFFLEDTALRLRGQRGMTDQTPATGVRAVSVLVIDHEEISGERMRRLFAGEGASVKWSSSALEGLSAVVTERPQVVVVRDDLPNTSATAISKLIHGTAPFKDLPVASYGGYGTSGRSQDLIARFPGGGLMLNAAQDALLNFLIRQGLAYRSMRHRQPMVAG